MRTTSRVAVAVAILTVTFDGTKALAPNKIPIQASSSTSLNMMKWNHDSFKKLALSAAAATVVLGNIADPAFAQPSVDSISNDFGASSQMISARSGGRAGGRSAGARMAPRPSSSSHTTINTRVIERTRYIPSPVYSSPSVILAPPVYNPLPGFGFGLGLNAINQIGNDMRDYRQENEIRDTRAQLEEARIREAEMEARLRMLERGPSGQPISQQQQQAVPAAAN